MSDTPASEASALPIKKHTVVSFHYTLRNSNGDMLETSGGSQPSLYLHGHNNIIRGLELEMEGKNAGDKFTATISPELGYGVVKENQVQRVPAKYLKHEKQLRPGKVVQVNSDKGARTATVVKVGKFNVDVDFNHPLAGRTLTFEIEVLETRAATAEEKAHGHAHGIGGHQH